MRIDVITGLPAASSADFSGKTALVIDVLRATSNMVTALAYGASAIVPVETIEEATAWKQSGDLLAGERECRIIPGFDLGNSPREFMRERVAGRRIVMTTTNGTRVIRKALQAQDVFACSLLNARACVQAALAKQRDIVVICSGVRDAFAWEDGLCAGLVVREACRELAEEEKAPEINDFGLAMQSLYLHHEHELSQSLLRCEGGKRLTALGFLDDILYCSQSNLHFLVPALVNGVLQLLPVTSCSR